MRKEDLESYQRTLLELRSRLMGGLNSIVEEVVTDHHAPNEPLDAPSDAVDKSLALQETEESILTQVREALQLIESGRYGKCIRCGETIPPGRLQAIPYTRYCVECARRMEVPGAPIITRG